MFGRLSIRRRIALTIFLSFIVILPSVSMSMFYFSGLLRQLAAITEEDVRIGRMANDLALIMLDIRRDERNYRMFGNSAERDSVLAKIDRANRLIGEARGVAGSRERVLLDGVDGHLMIYTNSFSMLADYISQNPPEEELIRSLRARLSGNIADFQARYSTIISELDNASPAQRDSILSAANSFLNSFSVDLLNAASSSDGPDQPSYIQENLDSSRAAFIQSVRDLAGVSWDKVNEHKEESLRIEARAKRNIITVLMLTVLICLFMVVYFPKYIVRPITTLNRTFTKAGDGDFDAQAVVLSNDEIGDLAASYNRMMVRLNHYDDLKTRKISSQKRIIERLLDNLAIPVCILNDNLRIIYYNDPFAGLFGVSMPQRLMDGGLSLDSMREFGPLLAEMKKVIARGSNDFTVDVATCDDASARFRGRIIRDQVLNLDSVILVMTTDGGTGAGIS